MDSKRPARRDFLKSGAALAGGFTLGGVVPASGQAPASDQAHHSPPMIKEGMQVQFRAEIFNLLNTAQFDLPNASIGAAQAGMITGIVGTPRQIQFGGKFVF